MGNRRILRFLNKKWGAKQLEDYTEHDLLPGAATPDDKEACGVREREFPCMGKCCGGCPPYEKTCLYGIVWTSCPDPSSLEITTIFECRKYGYRKRIKG